MHDNVQVERRLMYKAECEFMRSGAEPGGICAMALTHKTGKYHSFTLLFRPPKEVINQARI